MIPIHSVASGGASLTRLAPIVARASAADCRVITAVVLSDEFVDRNNNRFLSTAWATAIRARQSLPLLAFGDTENIESVCGLVKNLRLSGGRLLGDAVFVPGDVNPAAETLFQLFDGGWLKFMQMIAAPLEYARAKSPRTGLDITKADPLAVEAVAIGTNPNAIVAAKAAGVDLAPLAVLAGRALTRKDLPEMSRHDYELIRRTASTPLTRATPLRPYATVSSPAPVSKWESFGHFLRAVALGSQVGETVDRRLIRAPSGANETDPTAGGFAVEPEFADELIGSLYEEATVAPLCDRRHSDKPADIHIPAIDELSRADGSRQGGTLSYWEGEAVSPPKSLPRYKMLNPSASKLIALCQVTEELFRDVPLLESHVRQSFGSEASFKLDLAILRGTGVGTPLGITNSAGTITVPKLNGQAQGSVVSDNVAAMWSRLPGPCRKRACWIVNEDAEAQLDALSAAGTSGSTIGMYFPAGTGGNPYPLLKGRPVLVAEQCQMLGTPGDIILGDFSQYAIIDSRLKSDLSLHVLWTSFQGVFRFVLRVAGLPMWSTPITPYNGGPTRAPFVILAQR